MIDHLRPREGVIDRLAATHPFRGLGEPEDIAKAAVFLASEDASWITGIPLVVDGQSSPLMFASLAKILMDYRWLYGQMSAQRCLVCILCRLRELVLLSVPSHLPPSSKAWMYTSYIGSLTPPPMPPISNLK